ncbi:hypothetical protein CP533_5701 [Ophiocordyceps camponoti-saundersi (nom. inval.)]|nr:hypothetical protein CP533_5701 [Ophiocordyceps camponoti-saundersi (nom. inval.)]
MAKLSLPWIVGFIVNTLIIATASPDPIPETRQIRRGTIQVPDFKPITIDVHAHIYVKSESTERLTRRALENQIELLNEAYLGIKATFVLQTVEWIVDDVWAVAGDVSNLVFDNYVGNYSSFNLHIVEHLGAPFRERHGLCSMPFSGSFIDDSCIFSAYNIPGGPGSNSSLVQEKPLGKIVIHGVGHWLGLHHPSKGLCHGYGDKVADLPVMLNVEGCPAWGDTCPQEPGYDPIHNYMVYASSEVCKVEFTPGQLVRMRENWDKFRASGRRRKALELKRLRVLRQNGRLPYYAAPPQPSIEYKVIAIMCSPDRNGIYRELREEFCGTSIFCRNELYKLANSGGGLSKMSWRECLNRRTDTIAGFEA